MDTLSTFPSQTNLTGEWEMLQTFTPAPSYTFTPKRDLNILKTSKSNLTLDRISLLAVGLRPRTETCAFNLRMQILLPACSFEKSRCGIFTVLDRTSRPLSCLPNEYRGGTWLLMIWDERNRRACSRQTDIDAHFLSYGNRCVLLFWFT